MREATALKHLEHMMLAAQKARSIMAEVSFSVDDLDQYDPAIMLCPWLVGPKSILPTLADIVSAGTIDPPTFWNIMTIADMDLVRGQLGVIFASRGYPELPDREHPDHWQPWNDVDLDIVPDDIPEPGDLLDGDLVDLARGFLADVRDDGIAAMANDDGLDEWKLIDGHTDALLVQGPLDSEEAAELRSVIEGDDENDHLNVCIVSYTGGTARGRFDDPRTEEQKDKLRPAPLRIEAEAQIPVVTQPSGGRTSKPAPRDTQPSRDLTLVARSTDGMSEGFRVEWVSFDGPVSGELTSGAGCGSPWMTLTVTRGDERHVESVDIRQLVTQWTDAIVADMDAGTIKPAVWVDSETGEPVEVDA